VASWFERRRANLVFGASILCTITAWPPPHQAQAEATLLEIELDAFSGRPNPRWELTGAQAEEFLARLRALSPTHGIRPGGGGLGYRGFTVKARGKPMDDFDEVRLYHGTVLARHGDRMETFGDPGRVLERWLLDSGRGEVPESVLRYIQSEIGH